MRLTDGTVTLRHPSDDDADAVVAAVQASLPELAPWMPWATSAYDKAGALSWIRGELDPSPHSFLIIGPDGSIAGTCGLNKIDETNKVANLGYWLRTDCTGNGWATEVTRLVAHHGLGPAGLHRVEIIMSTANEASRRVAEKAGAHYEGVLRESLLLHGTHHDVHIFSLLAADLDSDHD